ncbi:hypothetical protein BGZ61DRAFT_313157, partial [Ilyonectria robusta]|uniref:uncharacterized protein n=1 Tax=Ilyonectria robusta TaxID=1079257 RepID=UPI001E8EBC8C
KKAPVYKSGSDEDLINVKYSEICHTNLDVMMSDWPLKETPLLGSHEGTDVVVAKVELVMKFKVRDHASIE